MRVLVRFFFSPVEAVFLPASFFSATGAFAGALLAVGFFSAAFGGILMDVVGGCCEGGLGMKDESSEDVKVVDVGDGVDTWKKNWGERWRELRRRGYVLLRKLAP